MKDIRNGVWFGADDANHGISDVKDGIHTYKNYGAFIKSKTINLPKRQTYTVKVPARNGIVDLTETLYGEEPKFENRKIQIVLMVPDNYALWNKIVSKISNDIHGYTKYICFDDDPEWAYHGRVSIDRLQTSRLRGLITLNVDADPFRREINSHGGTVTIDGKEYSAWKWDPFSFVDGIIQETVKEISGSGTMTIRNADRNVSVEFKATASMSLKYGGTTYQIGTGDWTKIRMDGGEQQVTITGTGTVYSRWRGEKI